MWRQPTADDAGIWLSQAQVAALCGLGQRQFRDTIDKRLPAEAKRGTGGNLKYAAAAAVAALVEYRLEQQEDPVIQGAASPAQEECRRHEARLRKIKADEAEKLSVPRHELEPALSRAAAIFRQAAENLQRRYGNEAAAVMNEAINECEAIWTAAAAVPVDAGPAAVERPAVPDQPPADHAAVRGRRAKAKHR